MAKTYNNVMEMLNDLSATKDVKNKVRNEIKGRILSCYLCILRCANNLTQEDMAKKLKCSQSRISKIELSLDRDLTMGNFLDYANVCNLDVEIGFRDRNVKKVDLIKYHASRINTYLGDLRKLARGDDTIIDGIIDFHEEAEVNLKKIVRTSKRLLGEEKLKRKIKKESEIHISPPLSEKQKSLEKTEENVSN